jgi:hypothetical protein
MATEYKKLGLFTIFLRPLAWSIAVSTRIPASTVFTRFPSIGPPLGQLLLFVVSNDVW